MEGSLGDGSKHGADGKIPLQVKINLYEYYF